MLKFNIKIAIMSKKVKIYCYKLAKPVAKNLTKNLGVGRIECEVGFIKEHLGLLYFITTNKLSKGDEIALSNDYKFAYSGSLFKKINYIPYETAGINASDGSFKVMPGKSFISIVDPESKSLEVVILDDLISKIFTVEEEKVIEEVVPQQEIVAEEQPEILNEEPVVSQVTLEEQEPVMSTDPLDGATLVLSPEDFTEEQPTSEVEEKTTPTNIYSENPEEWFEEDLNEDEIKDKIKILESENFKLSNKINNTIEELKNMTIWDILFWRWKEKLLDILNL
jgi:hypothetical protein